MPPLLEVTDLSLSIRLGKEILPVLLSLSFSVAAGETLAIVGETGSGKTLLALSLMGLTSTSPFCLPSGSARLEGQEILSLSPRKQRRLRGHGMAMIFQQPRAALNPVFPIGEQLIETALIHADIDRDQAYTSAKQVLSDVQLSGNDALMQKYPHELSGGMLQRVMIALALLCAPKLLIADEPTTALDASIQKDILDLLTRLTRERNMGLMLISHDLHLVRAYSDRILVLYAGEVVETGPSNIVFSQPSHPYTQGLLLSTPIHPLRLQRIPTIPGSAPGLRDRPVGCTFHPRCSCSLPLCQQESSPVYPLSSNRTVRCWLFDPHLGALIDAETPV